MSDDIHPPLPNQPGYPQTPTHPPADAVTHGPAVPAVPAPVSGGEPAETPQSKSGFWRTLWKGKQPQPNQVPVDSTREVIETVVFVVVLVLLLKSFVAEAFVIPTGSMASTLYGYQKIVTCPECDYLFPVNCSREVESQEGSRTERISVCECPNCRKLIYLQRPSAPETFLPPGMAVVPDPGPSSGDRVLVAKFLYDLFQRDPDRLDVVVFKFPGNGERVSVDSFETSQTPPFPKSGPFRNHVPMNYIKRLIGLPGETIAIQGGKLYRLPPDKSPKYDDRGKVRFPEELWLPRYMHVDDDLALQKLKEHQFEIIRKGPQNILAMKRLVYDNDHQPRDLKGKVQRWSGEGWKQDDATGFTLSADDASKMSQVRYRHLLRDREQDGKFKPQLITDFMGYNSDGPPPNQPGNLTPGGQPGNWATDLILECEAAVDQAQGQLVLELGRGSDRFQAQFNLSDGHCKMYRLTGDRANPNSEELASAKTSVQSGTYRLRFSDVDEQPAVVGQRQTGLPRRSEVLGPLRLDPNQGQ